MKPIKLEIEGLHSFVAKQVIDFEKLSTFGIFGIFGKTGSGKSSILDAITLCLYGKVNRSKVKTDFINIKTRETNVRLIFEVCGKNGDIERYEIVRKYKIKKNDKTVDSFATLYKYDNEEKIICKEGAFNVDAYIFNLLNLSFEDFSKCIALPQGEFANFLKARPNERIEIIGNIFELDEFGTPLWNKVKKRVEILEKEELNNKSKIDVLGNVSKEQVASEEKEFEFAKAKLKALNTVIDSKKIELQNLESVNNIVKEQQSVAEKYKSLKFEKPKYEKMKSDLAIFKNNEDYILHFEKITNMKTQKKELENSIEKYNRESIACYEKLKTTEENLAQIAKKYEMVCVENLKLEEQVKICEEVNFRISALNIQIKKLQNDKNDYIKLQKNCINNTNNVEISLKTKDKQIKNVENKLEMLGDGDSSSAFLQEQIYELKSVEKKLDVYKCELQQSIQNKNEEFTGVNNTLKDVKKAYENAFLSINGSADESAVIEKIIQLENGNAKMDAAKYKLDLIDKEIHRLEVENETRKRNDEYLVSQSDIIKLKIENCKSELLNITQKVAKIEEEKLIAVKNAMLNDLIDSVRIGDSCPICKSVVIQKNICAKVDVSEFDNQRKNLLSNKKQMESFNNKLIQEVCSYDARREFEKSQILLNKNTILDLEKCKDIVLREFVDINDEKYENFAKMYEKNNNLLQNFKKITNIVKNLQVQISELDNKKTEISSIAFAKKECYESIVKMQSEILSSIAEKEFFMLNNQSDENISLIENEKNRKSLMVEQKELNVDRESLIVERNKLMLELKDVENTLANIDEKIVNISDEQDRLKKSVPQILVGVSDFKEFINTLLQNEKLLLDEKLLLESEIKSLNNKNIEFGKELELAKQKLEFIVATITEEELALKKIDAKIDFNEPGKNSYVCNVEDVATVERLIEKWNADMLICERDLSKFDNLIVASGYNEELYYSAKKDFDEKQKEKDELVLLIARQTEVLANLKNNLSIVSDCEMKLENIRKKLLVAQELKDLIRGKQLEEFVATEFINYVAERASEKLQILIEGRYDLIFENGDFIVIDNFNNGIKRNVNTLSGGELFIVSLSLALAISESIISLSNRSFDFFFLDEGFGSLDSELCEMVIMALEKLQKNNFTVGLISHVAELKDKIVNKIEINKTEALGSVVKYVFD